MFSFVLELEYINTFFVLRIKFMFAKSLADIRVFLRILATYLFFTIIYFINKNIITILKLFRSNWTIKVTIATTLIVFYLASFKIGGIVITWFIYAYRKFVYASILAFFYYLAYSFRISNAKA